MAESLPAPVGPFVGMLERADREAIAGWAADSLHLDAVVTIELLVDGMPCGQLAAARHRADLEQAGLGRGHHGFQIILPGGLAGEGPHEIRLRRVADGAELPGSPRTIPPAEAPLASSLEQRLAAALDVAAAQADAAGLDALIALLARRTSELLVARGTAIPAPEQALLARWSGHALAPPPDPRPRALFIDEAVPDPTRDAGANAALAHMQALVRLGYRVDFVPAHDLTATPAQAAALAAQGITCWHAPWIGGVEEVLRQLGEGLSLAYLHRLSIMQRYAALVRSCCPRARLLYCVADLHHLRLARQVALLPGSADPAQVEALRTAELLAGLGADALLTHSSHEAALLRAVIPEAAVHLVPWTVAADPTPVAFAARSGVGFIGSYAHPPNRDAAEHLIRDVMPLVWAEAPALPCRLAGSDLPASLARLAAAADGPVEVLGQVPSLRALWDRVRVSVAPLRFGAGLKGKVVDSLAGGIPCVCSPIAAEGMDLPLSLSGLVAEQPADMAALILRLHEDRAVNAGASEAGLDWMRAHFAAPRIDAALAAACAIPGAAAGR
ncbi:MAG: glycosyltransferase [Rhodospirillales bacterium]|nr:glycosyltransferase [Rhodospirillales bacterium]